MNDVEIIASICGIKESDRHSGVAQQIGDSLVMFSKFKGKYIEFVRAEVMSGEYLYLTGFQKWMKITDKFKKIIVEIMLSKHSETIVSRATELSLKIKLAKDGIVVFMSRGGCKNAGSLKYEHFTSDGVRAFTNEDIAILGTIGTIQRCIWLMESESGTDALRDKLIDVLNGLQIKALSSTMAIGGGVSGDINGMIGIALNKERR